MDTRERFWSKALVTESIFSCWPWTASLTKKGYGEFRGPTGKTSLAHRHAYLTVVGSVPPGLQLDHLCRNRACVNPWHLEPVTAKENVRRGNAMFVAGNRSLAVTHCPSGHEYTTENTYVINKGTRGGAGVGKKRLCKICSISRSIEFQRKRRAKPVAN